MSKDTWEVPVQTSAYVMLSSDYSAQEPRITSFVANDKSMIEAFKQDKDIYATIASMAFGVPYEKCLEFHPETHEYQPDGKERRGQAKTIVLGITYGRSVPSIGEQLYGTRDDMTDEEKTRGAQKIYDAVLNAFPNLRKLMVSAQASARKNGYTETILGRRRHLPDMQLPQFEFKPMRGYVNPDVDPLDPSTFDNEDEIPARIVEALTKEFEGYKYFGQIIKRTRELAETEKIKVINNRQKINDASRQCVNCVDLQTQILTTSGFKDYNEISEGDEIYGYDLEHDMMILDRIKGIHIYPDIESEMIELCASKDGVRFSSHSTPEHRWATYNREDGARVILTSQELLDLDSEYDIILSACNEFDSSVPSYVLDAISSQIRHLDPDVLDADVFESDYKKGLPSLYSILDHSLISRLSQRDATSILDDLFDILRYGEDGEYYQTIRLRSMEDVDLVQHLGIRSGLSCPYTVWDVYGSGPESADLRYYLVDRPVKDFSNHYPVLANPADSARGVWCITSGSGFWVARKGSSVFITHNSIIQGSAADQTKMAALKLEGNQRWHEIGGRILVPVHDELVAEVPLEYWDEGGRILSSMMVEAADFLPFPSKCDVTTTIRWYGLEYPCPYEKPENLDDLTEENVKWVQYQLCELEYVLPVYNNPDGSKPRGDASHGVNGIDSDELQSFIDDYCLRRNIDRDEFIKCVETEVIYGLHP